MKTKLLAALWVGFVIGVASGLASQDFAVALWEKVLSSGS